MGNKTRINLGLDVAMAAVLVLMQLPQATGVDLHRIAGIVLGGGVMIHLVLHRRWLVAMCPFFFKPLPPPARVNLRLNTLLLLFFSMTLVSGLFNSPMPSDRIAAGDSTFV